MKANEKKLIIILVIIIAIALIIFFVRKGKKDEIPNQSMGQNTQQQFYQELEDGTKLNKSTKLNETKTVNGLEIGNIQLTNKENQTVLLAEIENKSGKDIKETTIDITLLDQEGNQLGTIGGMIAPLKVGEKTQLNISAMRDYSNSYDFKVTVK